MTAFLSDRQSRLFKLLLLLKRDKDVENTVLMNTLGCSSATLTRALREVRTLYGVQVSFKKSSNTYQCTSFGTLTPAVLKTMSESVSLSDNSEHSSGVVVNSERLKKKAVSLSLPVSLVRAVDKQAVEMAITRSECVERLISQALNNEKAPEGVYSKNSVYSRVSE